MPVLQLLALAISLPIAAVGTTLFVRAIRQILATFQLGQPAHRTDHKAARTTTMVRETLGHTRMLQWSWVGAGHWFLMTGFGLLFFTLVTAFGQLFSPTFHIPLLGKFFLFEWATELFTWVMLIAIVAFLGYRLSRPRERVRGPKGRFFGSTMWQGYFVELVILGVGLCIVVLRGLEYALATYTDPDYASAFHFPLTFWLGEAFSGISEDGLANLIWVVATLKIVISFAWMITISLQPTMGVAWHRFLAFFNIFFKREASGGNALGGLAPMTSGGEAIDFEALENMDEDTLLGVGAVEDFTWKGLLDFSTCTECGRCQSQCPAWNTEKPLSPKMLILQLRDHAHAKAPYLLAESDEARAALPAATLAEAERPLVGVTEGDWAWNPSGGAVIDDDVLWSCTSCGACVQQCPVDIEHVDHIIDMRRYQVLVESNFPTELNGLFKGLENKGNPWNMSPKARLDWTKDLPFEVKVVGGEGANDPETLEDVEWLFWVGCAGAYEDRAKKTTRAVAELLDLAGVDFAVLGNGETCTGDPARRAGNEFVFAGLAAQNAETLKQTKAKKVVSTCAHCFNTLKNEYAAFGVELEVVHHTQLLNRLVREQRLTPVASNGGPKRSVTYHDPCYIGRHNGVYSPPRELLNLIPDAELTEMPRNSERSFCCGAGGARMWMEENIGERINLNRTQEAIDTGAEQIAVGCPFCRVMLSDGLTMKQSEGQAREEVEVLDVAQMLLASVTGETAKPKPATAKVGTSGAAGAAAGAAAATAAVDPDAVAAEPSAGDATQTEDTVTDTEDVGPLAKASGGSSLFDVGGDEPESPAPDQDADESPGEPTSSLGGGSLFDLGEPEEEPVAAQAEPEAKAEPETPVAAATPASTGGAISTPGTEIPEGGSLFDLAEPEEQAASPAAAQPSAAPPEDEPPEDEPAADEPAESNANVVETDVVPEPTPPAPGQSGGLGGKYPPGKSMFDLPSAEPAPAAVASEPEPEQPVETAPAITSVKDIKTGHAASRDEAPEPAEAAPEKPRSDDTVAVEPEVEASEAEAPESEHGKPTTSGEAHQPRTDTDISESSSLFDL